jgi:hypothetical protein
MICQIRHRRFGRLCSVAMAALSETTPLSGGEKALYFIPRNRTFAEEPEKGTTPEPGGGGSAPSGGGGGGGVEMKSYAPKVLDKHDVEIPSHYRPPAPRANLWSWFTGYTPIDDDQNAPTSRATLPRKVPVKVEPKVFFANERTYLAWIHMAVKHTHTII